MKNIDETKNYFVEVIEKNKFMSKKHKKVCTTLNYIEHFLILAFDFTGCILISTFVCLLDIPIGITKSVIGLNIFAIAAGVKKWKSITKKKRSIIKQYCSQNPN